MRYQKIHSQIWQDEKFIKLSEQGKYLFLYVLTSPHNNALGLYVLPRQYICSDLGWTPKQLRKPFEELLRERLILYDTAVNLICIKNHLKHNTVENKNQAIAARKIVESLPKSLMYSVILEQLREPYHEPLREQLAKQYAKPETETETETEEEKEKESIKKKNSTPSKTLYGTFVQLTESEYSRLVQEWGEDKLKLAIEGLDYSINKGGKYLDHNLTLRNWNRRGYFSKDMQDGKADEADTILKKLRKGEYDGRKLGGK
jgi:hypothetical protein